MSTIIHTPTPDIKQSLDFYRKLNFEILSESSPVLVADSGFIIEINESRYARAGLKFYKSSWKKETEELKKIAPLVSVIDGYLLSDPTGTWIYLAESVANYKWKPNPDHHSSLGHFAGISLETIDIQASEIIWKILGFRQTMGSADNGWVAFQNAYGLSISLMAPNACPHLFFNPSLTYFNGGSNLAVIEKVRKAGIPIAEEITYFNKEGIVDNIILRDPGGYGFFIFND